jgi:fructokinase
MSRRWGAIEAGGTKFVVTAGTGPEDLATPARFDTTRDPRQTVSEAVRWLKENGPVDAVGVACFGPVDLARGVITTTPKEGWRDFPIKQEIEQALGVPVRLDTDVNVAGLGEAVWGAARGLDTFIYLTVGTGIGGGGLVRGRLLHGKQHPEMGHLLLPPHPDEPAGFEGVCPWHKGCLEGLASGPAIQARWGRPGHHLPPEHPAWLMEAHYLALALANLIFTLSPQRIIMGGGVMDQAHLFPMIRRRVAELVAGYVEAPEIVPPEQKWCGVLGAIALAAGQAEVPHWEGAS